MTVVAPARLGLVSGIIATCSLVAVVCAAVIIWSPPVPGYTVTAEAVVALALLGAAARRRRIAKTTPAVIVGFGFAVTGLAAPWLYPLVESATPPSALVPWAQTQGTTSVFLLSAMFVALGALCAAAATSVSSTPQRKTTVTALTSVRATGGGALALAVLPALLVVVGATPQALLHRDAYLALPGPHALLSLGQLGSLPALALLGQQASLGRSGVLRFGARVVGAFYVVLYFSLATRALAVLPVMWVGGRLLAGVRTRRILSVAVAATLSFIALAIPLTLRGLSSHGLIPYLHYAAAHPDSFFGFTFARAAQNVLYAYPLTGYVTQYAPHIPSGAVVTSLNPAPSYLTNWAQLQPSLRINEYVPYNALGELAQHGWVLLCGYMFVAGLLLTWASVAARSLGRRGASALSFLAAGGGAYFLLQCLEYNLRSATRVVYYDACLLLFLAVTRRVLGPNRAGG